jgi:glycosyltransferase involved in cell wall biosynthesis
MKAHRAEKYLQDYGVSTARPIVASSFEGITQAVVIPILAERSSLFQTLASLARNPAGDLQHTLVICVVNNHRPHMAAEAQIRDNQETLAVLKDVVFGSPVSSSPLDDIREDLRLIARSELRAAYIDASSSGNEIPDRDGGVGTARKIGMDAALEIIDTGANGSGVICCLDADTLVEENYLSAVRAHFEATGNPAAVVSYAHQRPVDPGLNAAICCYEIFLRSYVIGLSYALSPYAFHAIGSTIACTAEGYVRVRGMNRRTAAEDFYFLNKLAKIGEICTITNTTVFPSARISERVPFGTGRRMLRFMTGGTDEYRIYDPRIFIILRKWFRAIAADPDRNCEAILAEAGHIHVRLEEYLRMSHFTEDWQFIRKNCHTPQQLRRQFHTWFDGLKTLKLVHHFSRHAFPLVSMFDGLARLIDLIGSPFPQVTFPDGIPAIADQYHMLAALRSACPQS